VVIFCDPMQDEEKKILTTSDGSSTTHTRPHVETSTESTSVNTPKNFPQIQTQGITEVSTSTTIRPIQPREEGEGMLTEQAEENSVDEAEDLLVALEEQGARPSSVSSGSFPEGQTESTATEIEAVVTSGVSAVSVSAPSVAMESNVQFQRSEMDASPTGVPSVEIASPVTEEMTNLQEFLSSPHGNNQIVERSPGGRYLRFMEKLGSGASKDVYRAYDTEEGIEVAWNVVHLAGVPKNERNRIVNEVRLLERLHHQNIISFHGSWVNRERQQVNFVTEILSSGTLKSFINKVQVIRWKIAKRWAVQILKGLEYLHSQDPPVIHRDLKCENIFINGTSGDLRIGDLGLSTVNRNGKVLSVLGTPEFMAPDMYEEGSYDEKVDIYAFGMCMLEIFTKEIPYRECNNPAQIYKKVMSGARPESFSRLKSTHAREFIELCMGYKNEDGTYVRPSSTELLAHPFLIQRANDDDEVEVEPPLQEQPISEVSGSNEYSSDMAGPKANPSAGSGQMQMNGPNNDASPILRPIIQTNPLDEDESDRFEEMPDSEVNNIRKVKVMMGRGEELKESEPRIETNQPNAGSPEGVTMDEVASETSKQNVQLSEAESNKLHYLVAAAVIEENEQTQFQQPYPDDVLKLVVTLPVEGQTQNVQFDFHLVEDDPIQVAKEMVAELGIPQGAVLEISETISSLARAARTKKHKFNTAQAQRAASHTHSQVIGSVPSGMPQQLTTPQGPSNLQHQQQHISQHTVQEYVQQPAPLQQPPQLHHQILPQGQDQNFQHQVQSQGMPYQDQAHLLQGQGHQSLGQQPASVSSLLHQMPSQSVGMVSGEADSRQAQYSQPGFQGHPQSLSSNSNLQHQGVLVNGEFHQHLASESKIHQTPGYGHMQPPPAMSSRSVSNANPQSGPQQAQPLQQVSQINNPAEAQAQAPANSYAVVPPHGQVQQIQAQAPGGNTGSGRQQVSASYPHDASNMLPQYQYAPQQHHQVQPGQNVQPGGSSHHVMQQPQQQQFQGGPSNLAQGYGQNVPQQPPSHSTGINAHQQLLTQQNGQNIPLHQQSLQQQQSHGVSQHQLLQPAQTMQNQQHPMNMQQQQVGHQHGVMQLQQPQQAMNHHAPVHSQQQQQHQIQDPGQHVVSAAPLNRADGSTAGERAPVMQPNIPLPSNTIVEEIDAASDRPLEVQWNAAENTTTIQRDGQSDSSLGALGGLPMDIASCNVPVDEDDWCVEELRKLDENFKKNMMRAKKVFVNRMDNLQRTQVQREAQHKKTLEQHQKDRAAFEKRLQQEEIEQNRRIEQMQKEWDRRREEVRLKQQIDEKSLSSTPPPEGMPSEARASSGVSAEVPNPER
jgi:WNK lysine deficient protein kinase